METLFETISQIGNVSEDLKKDISQKLQYKKYKKKDILLNQGEICDHLYFVSKGLLRAYYEKEGKDICSWFMKEMDFIIAVCSFFQRVPSNESIQALSDCELCYIHYDDLMELYNKHLEFNTIGRRLTEHYYCLSEERLVGMRNQTAAEKYNFMLAHYPALVERVPSMYLASYLGIARETLSRIKQGWG